MGGLSRESELVTSMCWTFKKTVERVAVPYLADDEYYSTSYLDLKQRIASAVEKYKDSSK
jgi:hypothetical protein